MIQQYKSFFLVTTQVLWIRNVWLGWRVFLCELMEMGDGAFGSLWLPLDTECLLLLDGWSGMLSWVVTFEGWPLPCMSPLGTTVHFLIWSIADKICRVLFLACLRSMVLHRCLNLTLALDGASCQVPATSFIKCLALSLYLSAFAVGLPWFSPWWAQGKPINLQFSHTLIVLQDI